MKKDLTHFSINKIDRPSARPDWVQDQVFDLFDRLGGNDQQMDFPTIYTSALNGTSGLDLEKIEEDMSPLLDLIITKVNEPPVSLKNPFKCKSVL